MKNTVFCLVLFLSFFVLFACGTPPGPAPAAKPAAKPASTPATSKTTPEPAKTPTPVRTTDIILDGAEAYTIVRGDTLSGIARKKYRNGFYYPLIMMASPNVVRDQDLIEPGAVLTVPRLQPNLNDAKAKQSMKKYFREVADITNRKRPADAAGLRKMADTF